MTPLNTHARSVTRVTEGILGYGHGKDSKRQLVCSLVFGDMLVLKPKGTRRPETLMLTDLYSYALRCKANKAAMEKLRDRKAKKAERAAAAKWKRSLRSDPK